MTLISCGHLSQVRLDLSRGTAGPQNMGDGFSLLRPADCSSDRLVGPSVLSLPYLPGSEQCACQTF